MFELRNYQDEGTKVGIEILNSKAPRKEIIVSPTGGGKSLYIAAMAKAVEYPLVVLQPSKELLEQNYEKLTLMGGSAEIYSASLGLSNIGHLTFATIGSIAKEAAKLKKLGVKGIIIDEAHLGTQKDSQIRKFIKDVGITNVVGLTATPIYLQGGMNGAELKMVNRIKNPLFRNIAHVTQISELVRRKFWTPLIYKIVKQDESYLSLNSNGSDFTVESQTEYYEVNGIEGQIVDLVDSYVKQGRKSILVFVPSIAEAESLKQYLPGSETVHNGTSKKDRERIVSDFKKLKIKIVINVNVLSVGFDHPELDTVITARATNSVAIYYQQIGRGVRIHPNKPDCVVADLSGNVKKFGIVEDLNFTFIDGWGWGMFSKDILLSNYPMDAKIRPTKKSLTESAQRKRKEIFEKQKPLEAMKLWFGKYNGKTLGQIQKEDNGYLVWMNEKMTFGTDKLKKLQRELKIILNL